MYFNTHLEFVCVPYKCIINHLTYILHYMCKQALPTLFLIMLIKYLDY